MCVGDGIHWDHLADFGFDPRERFGAVNCHYPVRLEDGRGNLGRVQINVSSEHCSLADVEFVREARDFAQIRFERPCGWQGRRSSLL